MTPGGRAGRALAPHLSTKTLITERGLGSIKIFTWHFLSSFKCLWRGRETEPTLNNKTAIKMRIIIIGVSGFDSQQRKMHREVPLRKSQHSKVYLCPPPQAPLVDSLMFTGKILYRGQILSHHSPQALIIRPALPFVRCSWLTNCFQTLGSTSAASSRKRSLSLFLECRFNSSPCPAILPKTKQVHAPHKPCAPWNFLRNHWGSDISLIQVSLT